MKILILICAIVGAATAQNCGISGVDGDTVTMDTASENTAEGALIWVANTFNVTGAAAVQHPHTRYLQGLRYPTRYEYKASAFFPEFIDTEWNTTLIRNVIFTCEDGSTRPFTFLMTITDENDSPPTFAAKSYEATVSLASNSTEPWTANITVSDADYEATHARVIVRSSNALITPFVDPTWTGEHPRPYSYKVDFFVSKDLSVGVYTIIFTADDGRGSDFTVLSLSVTE